MSYGGPNTASVFIKPPIKGSFPLDHDGLCRQLVHDYLRCLRKFSQLDLRDAAPTGQDICRGLVVKYFDCRMRNGLMEREEWEELGLDDAVLAGRSTQNNRPKQ